MPNLIISQTISGRCGLTLVAMLLTLPLGGCRDQSVPIYQAQGVVVWSDGQPAGELVGGIVSLCIAEEGKHRISPHGEIQSDGTFTLRTPGRGEGAPAGKYSAVVMPLKDFTISGAPAVPLMDSQFENHQASGLEVVVEPGDNQITLKVKRVGLHHK